MASENPLVQAYLAQLKRRMLLWWAWWLILILCIVGWGSDVYYWTQVLGGSVNHLVIIKVSLIIVTAVVVFSKVPERAKLIEKDLNHDSRKLPASVVKMEEEIQAQAERETVTVAEEELSNYQQELANRLGKESTKSSGPNSNGTQS